MLADGERPGTQGGRILFLKRNDRKKFFGSFSFYSGFLFVKKYFEKLKKVFLFCKKIFLKKFLCGKVFGVKFSRESFVEEKIFAES